MKPLIFVFGLMPLTASAQRFTFGIQGGVPTQTPLGRTSDIPFVLGPSVDIHIFGGLSLETGVLYHRIGAASDNFAFFYPENAITLGVENRRGSALELPFLAKYRFLGERRGWRPFVTGGPTVRRISIKNSMVSSVFSDTPLSNNPQFFTTKSKQWNVDPAAGVGVDMRRGRFHLEPEVRYSYWGAGKTSLLRKNQVHFLLGFRF